MSRLPIVSTDSQSMQVTTLYPPSRIADSPIVSDHSQPTDVDLPAAPAMTNPHVDWESPLTMKQENPRIGLES